MAATKTMSMKQAAKEILQEAGGPLRSDEIARRAIDGKLIKTKGKTPELTMAAQLAVDARDNKQTHFVRTAPATYGLRGRDRKGQKAVTGNA